MVIGFFFFFARLVQVKRGTLDAGRWLAVRRSSSVTCSSEASLSLSTKSSQTGLFLRAGGGPERSVKPDLVYC